MKGEMFAPLIGVVILGLALLFAGSLLSQERTAMGTVSNFGEKIRVLTYAEVAPQDILSSVEAYVRARVLEELSTADWRDVVSWIGERFPGWITGFFEEYLGTESGVRLIESPSVEEVGVERVPGEDFYVVEVRGKPGKFVIASGDTAVTVEVDVSGEYVVPFPASKAEEVVEEVEKVEDKIERWLSGKREKIGSVVWFDENLLEFLEELAEGSGAAFTYTSVEVCEVPSYEEKGYPSRITGISVEKELEWEVPGTGEEVELSVTGSADVSIEPLEEGVSYLLFKMGGDLFFIGIDGVTCSEDSVEEVVTEWAAEECRCCRKVMGEASVVKCEPPEGMGAVCMAVKPHIKASKLEECP